MDELVEKFLFREEEIRYLHQLFVQYRVPLITVTGPHSVGKSSIVEQVADCCLGDQGYGWFDCDDFPSVKMLWLAVMQQLFGKGNRCARGMDFVESISELLEESLEQLEKNGDQVPKSFTLIFDNAQHLVKFDNFLGILSRLAEFTDRDFCVVLISTKGNEFYRQVPHFAIEPFQVNFAAYTLKQVVELINTHKPEHFPKKPYENFVQVVLGMFYQITRDFCELRFVCESQFEKHLHVIDPSKEDSVQAAALWNAFRPRIKEAQDSLAFKGDANLNSDELSMCAKLVLISAYLASYNPAKTDRRFFLKSNEGQARKIRHSAYAKVDKMSEGPKPFPLERLLHIYQAIQEQTNDLDQTNVGVELNNHMLSQISTFVSQKLLMKMHQNSATFPYSSVAKYRIADSITYDLIKKLAMTIEISLDEYLARNLIKQ